MKAYLQILSTGTEDCSPSVVLHFDSQRYMINCGEGTQRLCLESRFRFAKTKTILFTRTHWDCIGGAPGMLLTLSDVGGVGAGSIKLLGGENLTHALASTRQFVYRDTMAVETIEFVKGVETYKDENLRITAVQVCPENFERASPTDDSPLASKKIRRDPRAKPNPAFETSENTTATAATAATAAMTDVDKIEVACSTGKNKNFNPRLMDLPRTSPNTSAISYIFQSPDYVGKFNKQAATDLGVAPGKLFGELVSGKSVLSKSGELVHPHQVISGARAGRVFMVVDCPGVEYLSSLMKAKEFERFQGSEPETEDNKLKADCIIHLGGHSILSHPEYKAWMQRFGPETQHIIANKDYCSEKLIWRSQSASSYKLSKLDPSIFPIPYHDNTPAHSLTADLEGLSLKAQAAESMLTYLLEPSTGWDRSEVVRPMEPFQDHELAKNRDDIKPYMKEYYELADTTLGDIAADLESEREEFPGKEVVLTALGTGSSHPSKYRNVSATLLDIPGDSTFLLDVGEGTYGQMFRQFGGHKRSADQTNYVEDRIERLKGIFISHLHADHHLGIVTVIDRWNKLRAADSEPLYLVAPLKFNTFLRELSDVQDFGYRNVQFIECEDIVYWRESFDHRRQNIQDILDSMLKSTGFSEIATVDVIHCPWSYGISMTHRDGWKIVYSGDTRPCNNLVTAGHGATVLLHEATFEDDKEAEALKKKHSTTQEAILVGEGMEAKFTMLTHFSQRYPKIPKFDSEDKSTLIGICFDLMSVKLGQIWKLPKFLPALQVLYSPQSDEALDGEADSQDSELKKL
ncbi:beta-lactamase-like protein [Dissophora ornata]|nr:beta-lactamase-like protein [Dissophora ornata]